MRWSFPVLLALALAGCGEKSSLPFTAGTGPQPQLPEPRSSLLPTVNVATAPGWRRLRGPSDNSVKSHEWPAPREARAAAP